MADLLIKSIALPKEGKAPKERYDIPTTPKDTATV